MLLCLSPGTDFSDKTDREGKRMSGVRYGVAYLSLPVTRSEQKLDCMSEKYRTLYRRAETNMGRNGCVACLL